MRLTTEQLPRELDRSLQPLYTVYGAEPLLALEAADRIRAKARAVRLRRARGADGRVGLRLGRTAPRRATAFRCSGAGVCSSCAFPAASRAWKAPRRSRPTSRDLPPDTVTLVQLPDMDWRAVKAVWFAALESSGVAVAANLVQRQELPRWISRRLAAQGQQADETTLQFLADRVEGNLLAARQEVQKLATAVSRGARFRLPTWSRPSRCGTLRPLRSSGRRCFQATSRTSLRMLRGLEGEGVAPPMVLWAIAEELRTVARVCSRTRCRRKRASSPQGGAGVGTTPSARCKGGAADFAIAARGCIAEGGGRRSHREGAEARRPLARSSRALPCRSPQVKPRRCHDGPRITKRTRMDCRYRSRIADGHAILHAGASARQRGRPPARWRRPTRTRRTARCWHGGGHRTRRGEAHRCERRRT